MNDKEPTVILPPMTRVEIHQKIAANKVMIKELESQNEQLQLASYALCDEVQQYTEETTFVGHGKKAKEVVVGIIHWQEHFSDIDTGETITVNRTQRVKEDGVWIIL